LEDGAVLAGKDSLYASSVIDSTSGEVIIKLVNVSAAPQSLKINLEGLKSTKKQALVQTMNSSDKGAENSLDHPKAIAPKEHTTPVKGKEVSISLQPLSVNVIKIQGTL
jgi:alpha-L-arabinofuranosidase